MKTNVIKSALFFIILFVGISMKSQDKKPSDINFCHSENNLIFLDSLGKCSEVYANEKGVKIVSFNISFLISLEKEPLKFTCLGNSLSPSVIKAFEDHKRSVNDVEINNVMGEKEGKPIKLSGNTFKFFF